MGMLTTLKPTLRMMTLERSTDQRNLLVHMNEFMVTSFLLSVEPSCLIVGTGVRCFLTFHAFIVHLVALSVTFLQFTLFCKSHCVIGHFSSTIVINYNDFRCSTLYSSFGLVCSIIVAFPCTVMLLLLKIPSHTSIAVAGSKLNDRLIPITTSYRAVVAVVEGGGLIRSLDNPSTNFSRRYSKYHGEATENPMYQTYTRILHC